MDFWQNEEPIGGGETIEKVRAKIEPYFEVLAQNVKGTHVGGRTLEIDLIVQPKEALVKDGFANVKVGIQFRDPLIGPGAFRDVPRKAKELIELSHTRFGEYGGLALILFYPGFFAHMRAEQRQRLGEGVATFEKIVAQFNIGELKPEAKNLVLSYGGARYWDSVFGVNSEREYVFTPLLFKA
jgi:hypothetical protein